jgi:ribosomal-protein-serine acetyltransferase
VNRRRRIPFEHALTPLDIPPRSQLRRTPLVAPRIVLSPIEPADGPELWETVDASRDHLVPWLPWVPYNDSRETSQRYAEACADDWDRGRALRFTIRQRSDHALVGVVGLDNCVHLHRNCDLGYWLAKGACGLGLMTEAARCCVAFAFDVVGFHRIRCAAAVHNGPSLRVIGRLGFSREGVARSAEVLEGQWVDHIVFSRLSSDSPPLD